ncbi:2-hydroxychromene-2-carboxylate isomerase [Histoplasma capsulatum G186AR]|uniref:2-hydroxychromene-2-carboxylate isomerase n=1 Tax=Ajellomyces capsulatus TaxID=5037 RepID=A0A8H7YDA8_AJECA|nr:2-hydroxychromene-2-carboxylate isomerase [Histoplasma capsulatum]QSS70456.1 2-hydroxychromene-2-carboxylate isomerase [Histoplasma capsulatum G186AR]
MNVQRALCTIPTKSLPVCFDALYQEFWVAGNPKISDPDTFRPILESAVGKEMAANAVAQVCKSNQAPNDNREDCIVMMDPFSIFRYFPKYIRSLIKGELQNQNTTVVHHPSNQRSSNRQWR